MRNATMVAGWSSALMAGVRTVGTGVCRGLRIAFLKSHHV
jgi:hypothetical protein